MKTEDKRVIEECKYWNDAALDPEVDRKYISDQNTNSCFRALNLPKKGRVIELGCGVGRFIEKLSRSLPIEYHGIDISKNMLDIADCRLDILKCESESKRFYNYEFKLCDGRTIPFDDKHFNSAFCVLVFQHLQLEAVREYIKEISRVLLENGYFRFQFIEGTESEPFSNHHRISDIREVLVMNNFIITKIDRGLVHHQWTWITAKKI